MCFHYRWKCDLWAVFDRSLIPPHNVEPFCKVGVRNLDAIVDFRQSEQHAVAHGIAKSNNLCVLWQLLQPALSTKKS